MSKRNVAHHKLDRRMGENIWGRPKSPAIRRPYAPGQHGPSKRTGGKLSDFGIQLRAKQKLRGYYGYLSEKQMALIYKRVSKKKGDTSQLLVGALESRLDAFVYRAKFAVTIFSARQLVVHGHILVNGHRVDRPSYDLKPGDSVEVKAASHHITPVVSGVQSEERDVPEYIEVDLKHMRATYVRRPLVADVPYPVQMDPSLVVEFYSRS